MILPKSSLNPTVIHKTALISETSQYFRGPQAFPLTTDRPAINLGPLTIIARRHNSLESYTALPAVLFSQFQLYYSKKIKMITSQKKILIGKIWKGFEH